MDDSSRHQHYELLNLVGYGLAKFGNRFQEGFGFRSKSAFYNRFVELGIVESPNTVKNRMDLFDPFFPQSGRRGWWQKGNTYLHRKVFIDQLFGDYGCSDYVDIVKCYLQMTLGKGDEAKARPIVRTKFRSLQETGLQAELFFQANFREIDKYQQAFLEDARLYGDGYDFQVCCPESDYLAEVKGVRDTVGSIRLTEKEYLTAQEYGASYHLVVVLNLSDTPRFLLVSDPSRALRFSRVVVSVGQKIEYHCAERVS